MSSRQPDQELGDQAAGFQDLLMKVRRKAHNRRAGAKIPFTLAE